MLKNAILVCMLFTLAVSVAPARISNYEDDSPRALRARIAELERRIQELEARIRSLEADRINTRQPAATEPSMDKPSAEVIREAIEAQWQHKFETFELLEVGRFNADGKYWPVRARFEYDVVNVMGRHRDTESIRCKIYRDDFGRWAAGFYKD